MFELQPPKVYSLPFDAEAPVVRRHVAFLRARAAKANDPRIKAALQAKADEAESQLPTRGYLK